jgi:protein tyrosine phosphatase (PTP) superfamily phosphohydrolase (DUF442 family)
MMADATKDARVIAPGLANASGPLEGVATAGQPQIEHLRQLADGGFKAVVDLRTPGEPRGYDEAAAAREVGLEYVNLPVAGPPEDETFDRFRQVMRDPGKRPVLVHCGSANRVGALLIPYLVLDEGQDPQEALNTAVSVGLRSQDLADAALAYVDRKQA